MSDSRRLLTAHRGDAGQRLDRVLARSLTGVRSASRTQVQTWIENGQVRVNGTTVSKVATRLALRDVVTVEVPADASAALPSGSGAVAENLPLDVLYEDEYLLALDKPAGVVVHPGYKHTAGTVMNALQWYARDWPAPQRPSIVGRLDRLTSGIVVVAKSSSAHAMLQRAMASKDARKHYLALVYGRVNTARGEIALSLRRDSIDRRRVVTVSGDDGARSLTRFERLGRVPAPHAGLTLLRCSLVTGRMHQLRVHLAARGWPIVGDPVYGEPRWSAVEDVELAATLRAFPRQALHAWRLELLHPETRAPLLLEARVPRDLDALLSATGLRLNAGRSADL